jgi:hypothetical protein
MPSSIDKCPYCTKTLRGDTIGRHYQTHYKQLLKALPDDKKETLKNYPFIFALNDKGVVQHGNCVVCHSRPFKACVSDTEAMQRCAWKTYMKIHQTNKPECFVPETIASARLEYENKGTKKKETISTTTTIISTITTTIEAGHHKNEISDTMVDKIIDMYERQTGHKDASLEDMLEFLLS